MELFAYAWGVAKKHRLAAYRYKRDFAVTPEPAGKSTGKPARESKVPQFCVQKHLARSLHYDLRLQHGGALLSWAIPKGPSLNPKDKRFAARTEDHPLEYLEFEGVIPEGYGAGIMMLWDRGSWQPVDGDVDAALKEGELKFSLEGVKLKGSWVLVRTRPREGDKEQWLLIKHKDQWAGELDVTTFAPLSVKSFGDYPDILRAKTIPASWRKRLPVQSGDTSKMLREIVAEAMKPAESQPARRLKAVKAKPLPAAALKLGNKRPKVTNLNKVLYPGGFTKGQVIDYYTRIAPLILPHLAGRAVTLKRYPDGVDGKAFFHKRCPEHRPTWVKTARITNDEGESIDYCSVGDISTLIWVANLAALELHVPLGLAAAPDVARAMIFDLDPGAPAELRDCIEVAHRVGALLAQVKLECFAKFSGKKGVHLLVPLNTPNATFDLTKSFARAVAQTLARDDPKRVTAVMAKESRHGKVFIDWSQNDRSKTTVCAYSLRAAEKPAISWPIDLDAPQRRIPTADRIEIPRTDPLAGVLQMRQELPVL